MKEAWKRKREEKKKEHEREKLVKEEAQKKKKKWLKRKKLKHTAARKTTIFTKRVVDTVSPTTRRNINKENYLVDTVRCYECGGREGDDDELWIGCDTCENWAHFMHGFGSRVVLR